MTSKTASIDDNRPTLECGAHELKDLMGLMLKQVSEAERRHSALLSEMHERLETLGQDARVARQSIPTDSWAGLDRIEDGMASLSQRISNASDAADPFAVDGLLAGAVAQPAMRPVYVPGLGGHQDEPPAIQHEPQPLRSAAGNQRPRAGSLPSNIDPFDVVESLPGNPSEPWSNEGAAALSRLYDSGEAVFGVAPEPAAPAPVLPAMTPVPVEAAPVAMAGLDRVWIDGRFAEVAERLEASIAAGRSDAALATLGQRFDQLDQRLSAMLANDSQPADDSKLQQLETFVQGLATDFDAARAELMRLRGIEEQLGALMAQVSDERISVVVGRAIKTHMPRPQDRDSNELQTIALAAAEAAVARIAQGGSDFAAFQAPQRDDADHAEKVQSILTGYIEERRSGEEQNALAMDALQQAMLRVLDRLDAMETAPAPTLKPALEAVVPVQRASAAGEYRPAADKIAPAARAPEPEPELELEAETPEDELPADPIARQRALLQASAQRAALAQREKQKTEQAPKGLAAKLSQVMGRGKSSPAKATKASGGGRLMVSGIALAVVLGFGATSLLTMSRSEDSAISTTAASPGPVADAGAATKTVKSAGSAAKASTGQNGRLPTPQSAAYPVPETVTEDIGANGSEAELDHVPDEVQGTDGGTVRAQMASTPASTRSPLNGMMVQDSASPAFDAIRGGQLPLVADTMFADTFEPQAQAGAAVELPPASVGPLSLRIAASKGDPSAEFEVATRLAEGKGTDQNFKEAARWYQRSASKGFAQAQYRLATLYERGLGMKADLARAKSWYQRSAEQGNVKSMHNLAVLAAGRGGVTPDYTTAANWFTQASNHGLADSQYNLAVLTESGLGVQKDPVQAAMWFILAARGGDKEAIRRRDQMKAKMDRNEWSAADHLARTWQPMTPDKLANDTHAAGELWKSRVAGQPDQG